MFPFSNECKENSSTILAYIQVFLNELQHILLEEDWTSPMTAIPAHTETLLEISQKILQSSTVSVQPSFSPLQSQIDTQLSETSSLPSVHLPTSPFNNVLPTLPLPYKYTTLFDTLYTQPQTKASLSYSFQTHYSYCILCCLLVICRCHTNHTIIQ